MTTPARASDATIQSLIPWLLERAHVPDDVKVLAADTTDAGTLVQSFVANNKNAEALRVIAAALPPREGVWWAWVSVRHAAQVAASGNAIAPNVDAALAAIDRWISNPDENARIAAWKAAERVGLDTPAGCAAAAVFFTSGSVAPPEVSPPVPPPAGVDRMLVGNAVSLAAAASPEHFEALAGAYLAQGLEVVKQLGGWDKAVALSREHYDLQHERHTRALTPPGSPTPRQGT